MELFEPCAGAGKKVRSSALTVSSERSSTHQGTRTPRFELAKRRSGERSHEPHEHPSSEEGRSISTCSVELHCYYRIGGWSHCEPVASPAQASTTEVRTSYITLSRSASWPPLPHGSAGYPCSRVAPCSPISSSSPPCSWRMEDEPFEHLADQYDVGDVDLGADRERWPPLLGGGVCRLVHDIDRGPARVLIRDHEAAGDL